MKSNVELGKELADLVEGLSPEDVREALTFMRDVVEDLRVFLPLRYQLVAMVVLLLLNSILDEM